jgi:hypothetical protein
MPPLLLTGLFNMLVFSKNHAWIALSADLVHQMRRSAWIYVGMTVFAVAYTIYLVWQPGLLAESTGAIVAFAVAVFTLVRQHLEMNAEKREMGIA